MNVSSKFSAIVTIMVLISIHYYYKHYVPPRNFYEKFFTMILIVLAEMYSYTQNYESLYISKLHGSAFVIYLSGFLLMPIYLIARGRVHNLVVPFSIVLYLLFKDSIVFRLCLLVFNFQYLSLLIPSVNLVKSKFSKVSIKLL